MGRTLAFFVYFFQFESSFAAAIFITSYPKDTDPFISCFHELTSNTSFQYLYVIEIFN